MCTHAGPCALIDLDPRALELLVVATLMHEARPDAWWEAMRRVGRVPATRRVEGVAALGELARAMVERGFLAQRYGSYSVPVGWVWPVLGRLRDDTELRERWYPTGMYDEAVGPRGPIRRTVETDLRLALVDGDEWRIDDALDELRERTGRGRLPARLVGIIGEACFHDKAALLPADDREPCLTLMLEFAATHLRPVTDAVLELASKANDKRLRLAAARLWVLRGDAKRARAIAGLPTNGARRVELLATFWSGDYVGAAAIGDAAVPTGKRHNRRAVPDVEGVCHVLASLRGACEEPGRLHALLPLVKERRGTRTIGVGAYDTLRSLIEGLTDNDARARPRATPRPVGSNSTDPEPWDRVNRRSPLPLHDGWVVSWLEAIHDQWLGLQPADAADVLHTSLREWSEHASRAGYPPVARELRAAAEAWAGVATTTPGVVHGFTAPLRWEAALQGLASVADAAETAAARQHTIADAEPELRWRLHLCGSTPSVEPRLADNRTASETQCVSLDHLLEDLPLYLTIADRRVLAKATTSRFCGQQSVLAAEAVVELVGDHRVVDKDGTPLRLVLGMSRLATRQRADGIVATLEPRALLHTGVVCQRAGDRIDVFVRDETTEAIVSLLGRSGELEIPKQGTKALATAMARLCAAGNIDITGALAPRKECVVADGRPVLSMVWNGKSLCVEATVAPLGLQGPHAAPGEGAERCMATNPGAPASSPAVRQCDRDLADERQRLAAVEAACPTLSANLIHLQRWCVPELEDALEVMLELQALGDDIVPAWPKGRVLAPPKEPDVDDMVITVGTKRDWLGIEATLEIDKTTVLSYRALMAARVGRRFVALGPGQFVALSRALQERLELLSALGVAEGEGLMVSPAVLAAGGDLFDSLGVAMDDEGRKQSARMRALEATAPPPPNVRARLRGYQNDGYAWLWRRTSAGLGACLADDMGLGKTLQALALLSTRRELGPALVVCPTSVVVNWCREAERFTPGLRVSVLADATDRTAAIGDARPEEILVCSYGIMTSESDALANIEWGTVVFDEAHALKNDRTQRTEAARRLRARARIGLTGTPVENRVQELWSLFSVLVPVLLGPKSFFDARFSEPIAKGDAETARVLRQIIHPFVLRRTKEEVLEELPPRTEVTVTIEPTPEQSAYYEARRQRAKERLEKAKEPTASARDRAFLLAEIQKLRQIAVDPRLLDDPEAPPGAKLDAVVEHVGEQARDGHRTLVFTQFLGSLERLASRLRAAGLSVLTLQGSTPARERARLVDAFQAGGVDAFVLSLRAGGIGMNLTTADHVVHLDPWWNPAVEDQATDRSHRIGQVKPVTVTRFVTEGTIEGKILELHEEKRKLADDLVGGLRSGGLDVEELGRLLAG